MGVEQIEMTAVCYKTKEIANMLGLSRQYIQTRCKKEEWHREKCKERGGGNIYPFATLPADIRSRILAEKKKDTLCQAHEDALCPPIPLTELTPLRIEEKSNHLYIKDTILNDTRRYNALAKADLIQEYLRWQRKFGTTITQKKEFIAAYKAGAWPKLLAEVGSVSWQTLERWKVAQKKAGSILELADKRGLAHKGRSLLTDRHHILILGLSLNPNAPGISQIARQVQKRCKAEDIFIPSEATIRRFIHRYTRECFDEWILWREGKKAWNDKCCISILRDWSLVAVGDIVIADGHTLNFETLDPATGKPKRMTLLLFFDGASNMPLGWEIMPTENTACISAAFRRTCLILGKFPRVVYLDNGKAFRAKFFKGCEDFTQAGFLGLYKDLGCEVIHAWPYHGQSKPVERFFGTMLDMEIWMPSYTGYDIEHKPARMKRGETYHRKLYEKMGGRPLTMEETHTQVALWFAEYASRQQPGTHLKGRTPAEVFQEGRGPGLTRQQEQQLVLMMLQKEIRTITKDGFRLNGRLYWHEALSSRRHPVLVRYDEQLSPDEVFVYTLDGEYLCTALDRKHHGIASGIHPAAQYLGSEEQKLALEDAVKLKRHQEKTSSQTMRQMLEEVVLPETRARIESLEITPQRIKAATIKPDVPENLSPTAEDKAELARVRLLQKSRSNTSYTPSILKTWKDSQERYEYLFRVRFELGEQLVMEDSVWMETYEATPEYKRYLKKRYDSLRILHGKQYAS